MRQAPHRRHRAGLLPALTTTALLIGGAPASAAPAGPGAAGGTPTSGTTGRVLVTVAPPTRGTATASSTDARLRDVAEGAGGALRSSIEGGPSGTVAPGGAQRPRELAERLRADPRVREAVVERRAAPRAIDEPALVEADPDAPGVLAQWWVARTRLPQAWELQDGSGVRIAVIDTGVDTSHPQLAPVVADSVSDGRGAGDPDVDVSGHGTHVASLACSAFDDGAGIVGAGGRCRLIAIRSDLSDSSVASSIDRARRLRADVVVMSFGTDPGTRAPRPVRDALERAVRAGVVPVAAAADRPVRDQGYPSNVLQPTGSTRATTQGIGLSVTAVDADDRRAGFAGRGDQVSVASYGTYREGQSPVGILAAFPGTPTALEAPTAAGGAACGCRVTWRGDARYARLRGTSMAAPIAAGVAGLVGRANPDLSAPGVAAVVRRSARRRDGRSAEVGWGVVDAYAAVRRARSTDLRAPVATFTTRSGATRSARRVLRWRGEDRGPDGVRRSGVVRYELWRRIDGGAFERLGSSRAPRRTVDLRPGRNAFALRAVDRDGNRERVPRRAEITLTRRG